MSTSVNIRNVRSQEIAACAAIHNAWIDETDWMPRLHSAEAVADYYRNSVYPDQRLMVAETAGEIAGMMSVTRDDVVSGLYVGSRFRRRGIGSHFIERAKRELGGVIKLWTFQANTNAQSFYQNRDFVEINRTDGDNEEGLPDVLLEWQRS
jgi:ribosomal protein S18 acetylase RimI-like enzyme